MSEDQCQCCGFREIEYDCPALLCRPCWKDWFDTGYDAHEWRQLEWNAFFVRIGEPELADDPSDWPNKDDVYRFWRASWEQINQRRAA